MIGTVELRAELSRRERAARVLLTKRAAILRKVEALDREIEACAVRGDGTLTGRVKNEMSLVEALRKLLSGKELGIPEIVPGLSAIGYMSTSPHLRTMVNAALLRKQYFKRVRRGVYTAK